MAELRKCSRCRSEIELKYFAINRKGEHNKTCETCLSKNRKTKPVSTVPSDDDNVSTATLDTSEPPEQEPPINDILTNSEPPIMVFDVEHTGCMEQVILQLSWGLYTRDGTLIEIKDYFLKPNKKIFIHPRAIEKHHITYDVLLQKPNTLDITDLLTKFMEDASRCGTLVAHNMKGDLATLNSELHRHGMDEISANTYCAMVHTKIFCNAKDIRNRLKNPRLDELHLKLFDSPLDNTMAHNSCYDVEMCAKCYFKYRNMKF